MSILLKSFLQKLWQWVITRRLLDGYTHILGVGVHYRLLALYTYGLWLSKPTNVLYLAAVHLAPLGGVSLQSEKGRTYVWIGWGQWHTILPRERKPLPLPPVAAPSPDVPF